MSISDILKTIVSSVEKVVTDVKTTTEEVLGTEDKNTSPLFETEKEEEKDVDKAANEFAEAWDSVKKTGKDSDDKKVGSQKQLSEFVSDKRDDVKEEVKANLSDVKKDFAETSKALGGSFSDGTELVSDIVASVSKNAQNAVDLAVGMGSIGADYLEGKIQDAVNDAKAKVEDVQKKALEENDVEGAKEEIDK